MSSHSLELRIEDGSLIVELIRTDDDYDVPWIEATASITLDKLADALRRVPIPVNEEPQATSIGSDQGVGYSD